MAGIVARLLHVATVLPKAAFYVYAVVRGSFSGMTCFKPWDLRNGATFWKPEYGGDPAVPQAYASEVPQPRTRVKVKTGLEDIRWGMATY